MIFGDIFYVHIGDVSYIIRLHTFIEMTFVEYIELARNYRMHNMASCQFLRVGLLHVERRRLWYTHAPENHQFHGLEWVQKEVVSYWNLLYVLRLGITSDF